MLALYFVLWFAAVVAVVAGAVTGPAALQGACRCVLGVALFRSRATFGDLMGTRSELARAAGTAWAIVIGGLCLVSGVAVLVGAL
jgi:hypothetical protein